MKFSVVVLSASGVGGVQTVESDQHARIDELLNGGHQLVSDLGEVAIRKVGDSYIVDVTKPAARKTYYSLQAALDRAEQAVEDAKEGGS